MDILGVEVAAFLRAAVVDHRENLDADGTHMYCRVDG
jgi:hypothetical protein